MSNSSYDIRSGYFKVTDEERLKVLVEAAGVDLITRDDGYFAFGTEGNDGCSVDGICIEVDGEEVGLEFPDEIQAILAPGEVCIIHENVHEKLAYVSSFATIITNNHIKVLDFQEMFLYEAKQMCHEISNDNLKMNY